MARGMKAALAIGLGMLFLGALVVGPGLVMAHESEHGGGGHGGGGGQGDGEGQGELTHLSLEGFVDVSSFPPTPLSLPLGPVAPAVVVTLTFGVPAVQVPITITPDTRVKGDDGVPGPITLTDGDRVKVDVQVIGNVLFARRLQLEEFPELKLRGAAKGIPGGSVHLPLASGALPVDFIVALGGSSITLPVRVTDKTNVKGGPFTLHNGDPTEVKAIVNNFMIVAVQVEREDDED